MGRKCERMYWGTDDSGILESTMQRMIAESATNGWTFNVSSNGQTVMIDWHDDEIPPTTFTLSEQR